MNLSAYAGTYTSNAGEGIYLVEYQDGSITSQLVGAYENPF